MKHHRRFVALAASIALLTGCSGRETPTPGPAPSAAPAVTSSPASAFCLNLPALQVGLVLFRNDLDKGLRQQNLDVDQLRQRAAAIVRTGEPMRADAPPDIAARLDAALDAVATAATHLQPGGDPRQAHPLLFGPDIAPTFRAVEDYQGCPR